MSVKRPLTPSEASPGHATWIWYPGDFEIWLGNIFNNRRTERGAMFPPFWKQDSHYVTVEFSRSFVLEESETVTIACEGQYNVMLDGKLQFGMPRQMLLPAGHHRLNIKVWNQQSPPALYVEGRSLSSDSSWQVTYEDKIWIDENGVAHGSGVYVPAASWCFNQIDTPPSSYRLETEEQRPVGVETVADKGVLYDFGRETFGYLRVLGLQGSGRLCIYYGESREEALDAAHCETLDVLTSQPAGGMMRPSSPVSRLSSKAFRYVCIVCEGEVTYDQVLMDYEYSPHSQENSGSFRCSDDEMNRIWQVSAYTMDLTTREFFMDGIKRDRWTWSGDAIQSYLMNYYLRYDTQCVKRTIRQLRGKDPVTAHVNTIMDYTFYWFKSVLDYYQYTADVTFVCEIWPRMVTLMDYVLGRTNADGMAEGRPDDWIFVDWTDFPMHKRGVLCFEQILLCRALETMATCANLLLEEQEQILQRVVNEKTLTADFLSVVKERYAALAGDLHQKIRHTFWDKDRHAYVHAVEDGQLNPQITKFPNMFAILYGLADADEQQQIMQHVMLNGDVPPITTPYMRFYELETLCLAGMQEQVLREMRDYWGGMLRQGATSFWEKYVPSESGVQHLAMYGRPYGKSLCHAWGASPVYLLGRYYLGVRPVRPGYAEYEVCPSLGGLDWMQGSVPTPYGPIDVYMDSHRVTVKSHGGKGWLVVNSRRMPIPPGSALEIEY